MYLFFILKKRVFPLYLLFENIKKIKNQKNTLTLSTYHPYIT